MFKRHQRIRVQKNTERLEQTQSALFIPSPRQRWSLTSKHSTAEQGPPPSLSHPDFYSEWLIHSFFAAAKSHSSANSNSHGYSRYTFNRLLHGTPHLIRQPSPTLRFTIPGKLISTRTWQALRRSYPSNTIRIFHQEGMTFWREG